MTSPITKPTVGATGWNVAVDEVIDRVNDLPEGLAAAQQAAIESATTLAVGFSLMEA